MIDAEFAQVRAFAHHTVADAMDVALLTGQWGRALWVVQNKTGARIGIEVIGELAAALKRIDS